MKPLVSVVIPTFHRAQLVKRAVMSALTQSLQEIEVLVVIDGIDKDTSLTLCEIDDSRLQVIELSTNQGACFARDFGVKSAVAEWIAFLDDDDEWMPLKLELQLEIAKASDHKFPIVSSYLIAKTPQGEAIWPRRLPKKTEPLCEYLFVRNTLFMGEGLIQTSTIFTKKELLQKVSFDNHLKKHQDWDWILRAISIKDAGLEFAPQVLAIWNLERTRQSLSKSFSWQSSLNWIQSRRNLVTRKAYSSFILAEVSARAAKDGDRHAFLLLLREAFRFGKPQPMDICLYLGMWIFPQSIRGRLRNILKRKPKVIAVEIKSEGAIFNV
ncbi:glycosyltransferase family 2 protein [Calothrix sp. CCY 0018]|uniref:glycosyltransferase family 2 protein n=1 Tax=Calothrix sp. CCY 0018 TaxID=3103864 RepID=UPI0039C61ABA